MALDVRTFTDWEHFQRWMKDCFEAWLTPLKKEVAELRQDLSQTHDLYGNALNTIHGWLQVIVEKGVAVEDIKGILERMEEDLQGIQGIQAAPPVPSAPLPVEVAEATPGPTPAPVKPPSSPLPPRVVERKAEEVRKERLARPSSLLKQAEEIKQKRSLFNQQRQAERDQRDTAYRALISWLQKRRLWLDEDLVEGSVNDIVDLLKEGTDLELAVSKVMGVAREVGVLKARVRPKPRPKPQPEPTEEASPTPPQPGTIGAIYEAKNGGKRLGETVKPKPPEPKDYVPPGTFASPNSVEIDQVPGITEEVIERLIEANVLYPEDFVRKYDEDLNGLGALLEGLGGKNTAKHIRKLIKEEYGLWL